MFIEKIFGNTFGMIWLVVFMVAVLGLIVFMFVKKDKVLDTEEEKHLEVKDEPVDEVVENKEESENTQESTTESSEVTVNTEYEIIESEDGFFRVRKVGSERTLRKLATRSEAEEYIKAKG